MEACEAMSDFRFFPGRSGEVQKKSDAVFIVSVILLWGLGVFTLFVSTPDTAERLFNWICAIIFSVPFMQASPLIV